MSEPRGTRKLPRRLAHGITAALALGLLSGATARGSAQDTTRARLDSLAEALKQAQARLDAVEQRASDANESAVRTRSGLRLEVSGRIITQSFFNDHRVNNVDNPQFVRPDTVAQVPVKGGGMSVRQSLVAFRVTSPDVAGAQFAGDLSTDFYGGQQPSSNGRTSPLLRLRIAKATFRWSRMEVLAGQDVPVVAPINPTGVLASGVPDFAAAGNLWLWLPQLRVTLGGFQPKTLAVQLAVLAPNNGDAASAFETDLDAAERSSRPFLEARVRARWEMSNRPGELGCGGHLGWIAFAGTTAPAEIRSRAVACDLVAPIWKLELRGEAFSGQSVKGLGGGGIGQSLGPGNVQVRGQGGWAQLNFLPGETWSTGIGCGADDPKDNDLVPNGRQRNVVCSAHLTARPSGPLVFGLQARRMATTYGGVKVINNFFGAGFGFEF